MFNKGVWDTTDLKKRTETETTETPYAFPLSLPSFSKACGDAARHLH